MLVEHFPLNQELCVSLEVFPDHGSLVTPELFVFFYECIVLLGRSQGLCDRVACENLLNSSLPDEDRHALSFVDFPATEQLVKLTTEENRKLFMADFQQKC